MAKVTGLGMTRLDFDDDGGTNRDIRNDVTNYDFATPYNVQETTGVDKFATERLLLLADFSGTLNGVFNPTANASHSVFSGDLRVVRQMGITISAQTLDTNVYHTDYAVTRAAGGELTWQAPFVLADGTAPAWA